MIATPPPASEGRPTYVAVVEYDGTGWHAEIRDLHITTYTTSSSDAATALRLAIAEATSEDPRSFDVRTIVSYNRTSLD